MAKFGSLIYDKTKVDNSIIKLQEASRALNDTSSELAKLFSDLEKVRGFQWVDVKTVKDMENNRIVRGIDYAPKYPELCIQYINLLTSYIIEKGQEIEDYENAGLGWKALATGGMIFSKIIEGIATVGENIVDAGATIVGFTAGLVGNEGLKNDLAAKIQKDVVGDAFRSFYENGPIGKYSAISYNSTCANVFKGVGIATGYIVLGAATGGTIGVQVAVAGVGGLGAGTETGLQQGKGFDRAFWDGVKQAGFQMATAYTAGKIGEVVANKNPVNPTKVQNAQAKVATAEANVKAAKANVDIAKNAKNASQVRKAESVLKNANKNLDKANYNLSKVSAPRTIYNNTLTDIGTDINSKVANSRVVTTGSNVKNAITSSNAYQTVANAGSKYVKEPIVNAGKTVLSNAANTKVGTAVTQKASDIWKASTDIGSKVVNAAATDSAVVGNLVSSAVYTAPIVAFEESKKNYNMEHSLKDQRDQEVKKDVPAYVLKVGSLPQSDGEVLKSITVPSSEASLDISPSEQVSSTSSSNTSSNNTGGGWYQATRASTSASPVMVANIPSSTNSPSQQTTTVTNASSNTSANTNSTNTTNNMTNSSNNNTTTTPTNSSDTSNTTSFSNSSNQTQSTITNSSNDTKTNPTNTPTTNNSSTYTSNSGVTHSGGGRVNMSYSFDNNNNNNGSTDSASQSQSVLSSVEDSVGKVVEDRGQLASSITGTQATRSQTIKIPTVSTPIEESTKQSNLVIPTAAALSAAAATGIGTKAFLDKKNNSTSNEEYEEGRENSGFYSEEWNGTEDDMNVNYGTNEDVDKTKVVLDDDDDYRYNANSVIEKYENIDDNIDNNIEFEEQ